MNFQGIKFTTSFIRLNAPDNFGAFFVINNDV